MPRDIQVRTFEFARMILTFCEVLIRRGGVSAHIGRELASAASSVGANLEEGVAAQTKPDFIAKTSIALKEAREAHFWLRLAEVVPSPPAVGATALRKEAHELVAILTTIVKKSKSSPSRG